MNRQKDVFSITAARYDQDRSRLIPGFEEIHGWTIDLIPASAHDILDLGTGTGLLSAFVRARFPNAHLHLVDLSSAMLALAIERFAGDPLVAFSVAYNSIDFPKGLYDAVISALSIHHMELLFAKKKIDLHLLRSRCGGCDPQVFKRSTVSHSGENVSVRSTQPVGLSSCSSGSRRIGDR